MTEKDKQEQVDELWLAHEAEEQDEAPEQTPDAEENTGDDPLFI